MPESGKFLIIISSTAIFLCLIKMIKSGHFIKAFTLSALSGIGSLYAVNLISFFTGINVSINWFTLIFCSITGVSGSTLLVALNTLRCI